MTLAHAGPVTSTVPIGLDPTVLPAYAAGIVNCVRAITAADPGLTLLRSVTVSGVDLLAVHNQIVHMESMAEQPAAADGAPGHVAWLDQWACAEDELRYLLSASTGIDQTFREDWEIGIDDGGEVIAAYTGHCVVASCGLAVKFDHRHQADVDGAA